jgi:3-hydroxyisobutyrate dehydrogenase-like beta-hydroxyacid dehydrogenase
MTAVAFLGLGRMGTAMAAHLLADHDVTVWNRTPKPFDGARVADSSTRRAPRWSSTRARTTPP